MQRAPRCWGVGLARTGNTSFCASLRLLGCELVEQDPSFEALRDFKYLDYLFPGSKFVLTTRSVESWLASMERSHRRNPRPILGEHERIARRMASYETVGFDPQILAGSFERHHAEVRRYFAQRPQDLLELRVAEAKAGNASVPPSGSTPLRAPSQF